MAQNRLWWSCVSHIRRWHNKWIVEKSLPVLFGKEKRKIYTEKLMARSGSAATASRHQDVCVKENWKYAELITLYYLQPGY